MQTSKVLSTAARIRQLQYQWSQDRCLQNRIPLSRSWRGCLGLAILLHNPDDTYSHGDLALVRNEQLTWLAMRDIPGSHPADRFTDYHRGVSYASATTACLRHGMPVLDFTTNTRDAINFRRLPLCRTRNIRSQGKCVTKTPVGDIMDAGDTRRFAALNRVSQAMTRFAFFGTDVSGIPWQPFWAKSCPSEGKTYVTPTPAAWMPQPFLSFDRKNIDAVCQAVITAAMETSPSMAIFDSFSRTLADGLILRATGPEVYCGEVSSGPKGAVHLLKSTIDNTSRFVPVPVGTKLLVKKGEILEAAQAWARVYPDGFYRHRLDTDSADLPARWSKLRYVFNGNAQLKQILKLWFEQQFIRLESQPSLVLIPASLMASTARQMPQGTLWWDTRPILDHYDWETQVAVLPPVPLRHRKGLRISLLGDVAVNASITDPRWASFCTGRKMETRSVHFAEGDSVHESQAMNYRVVSQRLHCGELALAVAG